MTASGCHKRRVSKRSSALSCLFLKTLQSASRSFDGLRFSSLLHKERSRMAKGMSPLRSFMRNPSRKTVPDGVDGGCSGVEATSGASQSRQPLGSISITETSGNPHTPSGEPSTPRANSKISSQGQEKFPHLENSERHAASVNVTPDKTANLPSKVKFTWQHRHGPVAPSTTREGPDLSTPPRPPKGPASSDGQAAALSANNRDTPQTLRGCSTGGGSVQSTPKGGRSVGSKATCELDGGSQSQTSTPSKSVSRSLKYGQQGSSNNSGASGITNVRSAASQHVITRPIGYLQALKTGVPQIVNQNFVEQHFEVEEDSSFWCDHNVQVIIRTRPISNGELAAQGPNRCLKQESPHTVSWLGQPESRFTFDHIAGETITQAKLFDVAGLPMVENCMSGYNSCMFAYGQTGSGKTHTMLGDIEHLDRNPSENRGMTPRVFEYLFGRIRQEQECRRQEHLKFFCKCSFLEIYNEQITDLLEPTSTNLQMREDAKKGVYVENLSEVEVQCVRDVIQLLLQGAANRKVASTNMNRESSRSHSVFTCVVESKWEDNSMTNSRYGRLHLVDLAGSERQKSSGAEGGRLKEAANINKSLSTLGLVIMILVDVANGKQRHVPYRDSKLTFLLQDSLGGNSKTIMIANVSPSSCCATETLSTLKFAQRAKFIRNNAVINEDASGDVIALRQRIEELKGEVDRLRRESVLRISSSRILALQNSSTAGQTSGDTLNVPTVACSAAEGFTSGSIFANNAQTISNAKNDQHLRSMEAVLAGALRREEQAEDITKKLEAEIEQLNRLVKQREEDSQCSKMMLRFREEKIRRLEGIADNVLSAESFFADERKSLADEIQLIRTRLDRNPELTRFAMENMRLMGELRRYQEFYEGGERDVLIEEISGFRSQLLDKLDMKLGEEPIIGKLSTPQKKALAPELSRLERENELLLIEVKNYQNELKECRNNLNSCLVANADLARQVDELQATVKELQSERSERHEDQMELPSLYPQESASSADPSSGPIPLETEWLVPQQRLAPPDVEGQVSELKKQLQEAQDLIWQLSSEVAQAKMTSEEADLDGKHVSDEKKVNANVSCVDEDDTIVRQGIQDRWEKLQDMEMRHAEEITQLQLALDMMEDVVKEERHQRSIAEQKSEDLSGQLSAAVSELEQRKSLMEESLSEEQQQRSLAEQKCEELSNRLSAALSQLDQGESLSEDRLKDEREQRLVAEQRCEELSTQLSAAVSQIEERMFIMEEKLEGEKDQRLLAEQKCEDLSSQLTVAVSQLEEGESLVQESLKGEREQRLVAEQRCEELRSELSAAVSELEQGKFLMEGRFEGEKQQRLLAEQKREELSSQLSVAVAQLEQGESLGEERLKVEREQRLVAEQKCEELNGQLSAAVSQLEEGRALAEDGLNGEREQRLLAEQNCEELSCQLSAAVSQLEEGRALAEDGLKGEREQLLLAEQKCEELSSQLSAAVSQLEEGRALAEDGLKGEREQRLLAEQKCEELSSQLSAAVSQLEEGRALAEDSLKGEREQRLLAEQRCEELSSHLSVAVSELEQGRALAEDGLKGEREQRLLAEQKCEELSSQLSVAVSELERGESVAEETLKGEREQRLIAEQKCEELSSQLSAALSELEQGKSLAEERLKGEREQRLIAEQKCEDLSSQLTVAVSQLEEGESLADESLKGEREQRLVAEQRCEELRSELSAAVSELEQGKFLMEGRFEGEKQQRLLAEQKREELSSQLSVAVAQLEQGESLGEERLKVEREQRLVAEQKCEELNGQLSAVVSQLEQGKCLAEDGLEAEREQRLVAEQNCVELTGQLSAAVSQLRQAECLVEALEGQQLFSINELEALQSEHTKLLSKMKLKEEEEGKLQKQFQDESSLDDAAMSILEQKLLRARMEKEEARRMNRLFQEEKATRIALEKEREATMSEVETQAALAITTLQSEILELREEVSLAVESDAAAKLRIARLQKEVEALQQTTGRLEDNNRLLLNTSDRYRNEVDEKNVQLRALEAQCQSITSKLIDHLADGDKTLTEAAKVMDEIKQGRVREVSQTDDHSIVRNDDGAAAVYQHLHDVQLMVRETEGQVRALGDAAAAKPGETTGLKSEDGEAQIRESEKKSMVAFLVVRELLERIKDLKSAQNRLVEENQQACSREIAKDLDSAALQQQLEEVHRQFGELNDKHQLSVQKNDDVKTEYDRSSLQLEAKIVGLEEEIQKSRRALAAKDEEIKNVQNQLDEIQTQSTVIGDRYELLMATHDNLEQERAIYLEDQALKAAEGEHLIRLSERKAMAVFVMVEKLLDSKNELKAANMGLTKEIQNVRVLLAEKQAALATLQQQLEEDTNHHKEVADQYQLLVETHGDLQHEHEMLLVEKALRVEEGEAMVKSSERKALAAFVVVEELLEKFRELKVTNSSQAKRLHDTHLALTERDSVLASLQNEVSEYSDVARRHDVLTEAHENLRQDHERLVDENILTAEDGERAIKLAEKKAMAALVAISQIVDGHTELKAKVQTLERGIEEGHVELAKNTTELVAVQQELQQRDAEAMEVADQQQVLMAAHDALREEHNRLQKELNKSREGHEGLQDELAKRGEAHESLHAELEREREEHGSLQAEIEKAREELVSLQAELEEARDKQETLLRDNASSVEGREGMVKLAEKKAMGSLVMAEHLSEALKVLKATQIELAEEIEESRSAHLEKDARLAVVQQQLEESHRYHKEICDGHQVLVGKYENLKEEYGTHLGENGDLQQKVEILELDVKAYHSQVRVLQEMSVAAEQQWSEVCTEALKARSADDIKIADAIEFMTSVRDGLDGMWDDLSLVEEVAVDFFSSLEGELSTCLSKVLMLEKENGGNRSARDSLQKEISWLATSLESKEKDLELRREREALHNKSWEEERGTLASEKEISRRDFLEKEGMVQSLLLEVQTLDSTVKDRELRVSDMLTDVQVLTGAKAELELEKIRLVHSAHQAEANCSKKELEICAIRAELAAVQARLSAAELREQCVSSEMEQLTSASVAWEIESAVVEDKMQQIREWKSKLELHLNDLNLETGKRELALSETFRRSEEALERVETRMTAMDGELGGLEVSKENLEHDMTFLGSAATGYVLALEEKELECLELKRQLGIAEVQLSQMQSAMDLGTAQIAIEKNNREADSRRMEEERRAFETQLRDEIDSAKSLSLSTEGDLKSEVRSLESSLKQAEFRVSEMLTAVTALTVAKEELELERSKLIQASSRAEMHCREKEQELIAIQGDLAGVLASVAEAELREKSISGQLEEFAGARAEWELDRAVLKKEIEEMAKEKDQLRFELSYLNAEVEERGTAVFESFKRSQEALEIVETRLTAMEVELGGIGAVEDSIAFLDSALATSMVAFEENEHKFLKMQRQIQNAKAEMSEMQTTTDSAIAQFMLDRENWEVEKRRVKLEKDARETELRDEITGAQLKLEVTEGSLKTAGEIVEALGFKKVALEEEVRKLHEDAKTSLLKVAEQQQEIDSLREMSIAFKAESKEADDSVAALNQLREQYILAEANWRSEQELLSRKLEELEISARLQSGEGGGKESSDDTTDGGYFLAECSAQSEDQDPSQDFQQWQRQQKDNQVLRTLISEKERTIQSAKKELYRAVANCKETDEEMDKVHLENRRLIEIDLENKCLVDTLSVKLRTAEEELLKQDRKIEGYAAELLKVAGIMSDWETKMQDAEIEWRRDKKALAQELTEAKLVANEKRAEAASILQKFQDGQATLKEAEFLMDALVKANDNAKHDALDWKTERESLDIVQGWWMPERDKLVSEIGRLETDMHTQKQDIWIICKEAVIGFVETMDVLSVFEQQLHEVKNDHQQEMEHLVGEIKVLKDDWVSWLQFPRDLQVEQLPRSAHSEAELETIGRMPEESESGHCDREKELKKTLELELSRSELASVQETVCHLQVELKDQSKALSDCHEKLRSVDEVNGELLEKYNHGVMQWENEREERRKQLMEERLKQDSLGVQLEETRGAKDASISENGKLQSCLKAAEHSYARCSSELLALNRAVSAEDVIFEQLQMDFKHLVVDINEVKDQTLDVLVDELRADHEEMRNITRQMFALRGEVVEIGNLFTASAHVGLRQSAVLTEDRASNHFVQLYQQELEFTRAILTGSLAMSETLVSQLQDTSAELEDLTSMEGAGTMNIKFRSDFGAMKVEILNFQKTAEEEFSAWTLWRNTTGQDGERVMARVQDLQSKMKLEILNFQKTAEEVFRAWTLRKDITVQENERLMATVQDLLSKNSDLNSELDESRRSIDILEEELVLKEQRIALSLHMVNAKLKAVEKERDRYQTDLVVLNEQLDMAQSLADERDLVASEARQAAERSKSHAEEKEEEARILERSVEELESTVYALETQLGIVRRESERQRLEREALEKDLETLKQRMGLMQLTIDSQEAQTMRGLQEAEASKTELDRMVIEMKNQQIQARQSVESLQQECAEKDVQLRSSKAYITELVLGAEKQASENQQKLKALQAMVEHLKVEDRKANPAGGSAGKGGEKSTGKMKGSGSPFKCIGSGLEKQRSSEMDEELSAAKKRIKELEAVSASRQKEVFMLNTKLAEAESMTHDVIRDLLGVKVDIASYASLLNQQQVQRIAERARRRTAEAQQKEEELDTLRDRLNEFIEERESWLEEINRRQAEAVAARVSAEKLRLRDQTLTTENETFREDCLVLRKKVTELQDEIEKLSEQQNLQQRIHHHAKIKEENNFIKHQNEDLSGKLRRMEILFTRVNDELARYRTAEGKSPFINFDEEGRLQKKLQETEENRLQLAETLIGLCTGIMQAAGIQRTSRDLDPPAAMMVLQQLQDRQESLERELSDYKLEARIAVEKRRLSDLRDFHSPVKTISSNTNFTASQQLPSPVSSSR